ncbi:unnamed protein product [Caenorhabditis auriculariae]|uniref:Uncharacterized protein n=1 Tax=Caenorhabditis auriculariae TaxID=2777116 RepID=A0A8S1GVR1_9PELO|nr:unnamed protein product [Caenorhabditis auriculariae]
MISPLNSMARSWKLNLLVHRSMFLWLKFLPLPTFTRILVFFLMPTSFLPLLLVSVTLKGSHLCLIANFGPLFIAPRRRLHSVRNLAVLSLKSWPTPKLPNKILTIPF